MNREARATFEGGVQRLLEGWMPDQRWYPAKGRGVGVHILTTRELDVPADLGGGDGVAAETWILVLHSGDRLDVVQVPLVFRRDPLEGADHAVIGQVLHPDIGVVAVHDGPHDAAYVEATLAALVQPDGEPDPVLGRSARVLGGEQSNTSVIIGAGEPNPYMLKVFRTLSHGRNPDVEVVSRLSAAGCEQVPHLVGWTSDTWTTPTGAEDEGDLTVATEFLEGSEDAWRQALVAAVEGEDFTDNARALGRATGEVHVALAKEFGLTETDAETARRMVDGLKGRVDWAIQSSGGALSHHNEALAVHRDSLDSLVEAGIPALQRIHGDYHLGQVLNAPDRGWVLLDFEGEPLRPLAERTKPDLALRDVVGMLRSFDYAAGHVAVNTPDAAERAREWARAARAAFLEGYTDVVGTDPTEDEALYRALWLDKALYEVVYEVGNRPTWTPIPLAAVTEVL